MLNFELMKNPLNWLIVLFMLILAGMGGHLLLSWAAIEPQVSSN